MRLSPLSWPSPPVPLPPPPASPLPQAQTKAPGVPAAASAEKAKEEHFINTGEAALLLAFTGAIEVICWILDFIPYLGWIINIVITVIVGGILLIWLTGKVAKGAPKKWYKAIYWGAVGGAIPIVPGYLGAIIWLLVQDRKILGKVAGKLGEAVEKTIEKVK